MIKKLLPSREIDFHYGSSVSMCYFDIKLILGQNWDDGTRFGNTSVESSSKSYKKNYRICIYKESWIDKDVKKLVDSIQAFLIQLSKTVSQLPQVRLRWWKRWSTCEVAPLRVCLDEWVYLSSWYANFWRIYEDRVWTSAGERYLTSITTSLVNHIVVKEKKISRVDPVNNRPIPLLCVDRKVLPKVLAHPLQMFSTK